MKELKIRIKEQSSNKNIKYNVLLLFICMLSISCRPLVKTLGPLSSSNIEESKQRGVFLWNYTPLTTKILDTINLEIQEAFIEKQYSYHSYKDLTYKISEDKTQLVLILKNRLSELRHFDLWVLEGFHATSPNCLLKEYKNETSKDTLVIRILKVDINEQGLAGKEDKKEIGAFKLERISR
ncbi:MAG: hypothetical protein WCJ03_12085 [Bacteroidales bacterium]